MCRYFSYFFGQDEYDDPGVNVLMMDDELYAMTETNIISKVDPKDLHLISQVRSTAYNRLFASFTPEVFYQMGFRNCGYIALFDR